MRRYTGGYRHLWVVLTDPYGNPLTIIMVNLTSYADGKDDTVILDEDDHEWLDHESCVFYHDAREAKVTDLESLLLFSGYEQHNDMEEEVLDDIICGAFKSDFTPIKIERKLREFYDDDDLCED